MFKQILNKKINIIFYKLLKIVKSEIQEIHKSRKNRWHYSESDNVWFTSNSSEMESEIDSNVEYIVYVKQEKEKE